MLGITEEQVFKTEFPINGLFGRYTSPKKPFKYSYSSSEKINKGFNDESFLNDYVDRLMGPTNHSFEINLNPQGYYEKSRRDLLEKTETLRTFFKGWLKYYLEREFTQEEAIKRATEKTDKYKEHLLREHRELFKSHKTVQDYLLNK